MPKLEPEVLRTVYDLVGPASGKCTISAAPFVYGGAKASDSCDSSCWRVKDDLEMSAGGGGVRGVSIARGRFFRFVRPALRMDFFIVLGYQY